MARYNQHKRKAEAAEASGATNSSLLPTTIKPPMSSQTNTIYGHTKLLFDTSVYLMKKARFMPVLDAATHNCQRKLHLIPQCWPAFLGTTECQLWRRGQGTTAAATSQKTSNREHSRQAAASSATQTADADASKVPRQGATSSDTDADASVELQAGATAPRRAGPATLSTRYGWVGTGPLSLRLTLMPRDRDGSLVRY